MKYFLIRSLASRPLLRIGDRFFNQYVPIFMLHRFACPDLGIEGHDLSLLQFQLEYLRKRKFNFISVEDVVKSMKDNTPLPPRSIAFSIDDGYWDHVEVPVSLFAHYDCPVTYFVTTGFISKKLWLWDAKVDYLVSNTDVGQIDQLANLFPGLGISKELSKATISEKVVFSLANHESNSITQKLSDMESLLDICLPETAPKKYDSTSWDRLRDIERMGMCIAPHSYSHPILANESDKTSYHEIRQSLLDVKHHIRSFSNVFCYPIGRQQDYGQREKSYVNDLGFLGAVSVEPRAVNVAGKEDVFCLPRFGLPSSKKDLIQYSTWIESLKNTVRK